MLLVANFCDCLVPNTDEPILPPKTEAVVEDGCVVPGFVVSPWRPPNKFEDPACGAKHCPEDGLLELPPKTEAPDPAAATGKGAAWLSDDLEVSEGSCFTTVLPAPPNTLPSGCFAAPPNTLEKVVVLAPNALD